MSFSCSECTLFYRTGAGPVCEQCSANMSAPAVVHIPARRFELTEEFKDEILKMLAKSQDEVIARVRDMQRRGQLFGGPVTGPGINVSDRERLKEFSRAMCGPNVRVRSYIGEPPPDKIAIEPEPFERVLR